MPMKTKIFGCLCICVLAAAGFSRKRVSLDSLMSNLESKCCAYYLLDGKAEIKLDKIPASIDEFVEMRDKIAKNPMGGAAMLIIAMMTVAKNTELGMQFYTLCLDQSLLTRSSKPGNVKGWYPKSGYAALYHIGNLLQKTPWIAGIYVMGTSYENAYKLPEKPYTLRFNQLWIDKADKVSGTYKVRIYIFSTGGNLPRPIALKRNNKGIWKATAIGSVHIGPSKYPPKKQPDDDL